MLWDPAVENMLTLSNLAFPQICITTQKQSKQIQLGDKFIGSEGPSPITWAGCPANARTQHPPRKQLLSSEQLLLPERKTFPEERVDKEDGTGMGDKREMSKEKLKPLLRALLYSPAHQGTAARASMDVPRAALQTVKMMRLTTLRQLPSNL